MINLRLPTFSAWGILLVASACSTSEPASVIWDRIVAESSHGLQGSEAASADGLESTEEAAEAGESRHAATVFLGDTIIDGDHAATIGFDYEYRFHEQIGIGAIVDFVIEDREREEIVAAALFLRPIEKVVIPLAGGIDHNDGENRWLLRTGVSYEFAVGDRYLIAPAVYLDLVEGGEHATVLGVGFGIEF